MKCSKTAPFPSQAHRLCGSFSLVSKGVKTAVHLYLVPRFRMLGRIPQLPPYVFTAIVPNQELKQVYLTVTIMTSHPSEWRCLLSVSLYIRKEISDVISHVSWHAKHGYMVYLCFKNFVSLVASSRTFSIWRLIAARCGQNLRQHLNAAFDKPRAQTSTPHSRDSLYFLARPSLCSHIRQRSQNSTFYVQDTAVKDLLYLTLWAACQHYTSSA